MPMPQIVEVIFTCGHVVSMESPGVSDPAGIYLDFRKDPDGVIRDQSFGDCLDCLRESGMLGATQASHK